MGRVYLTGAGPGDIELLTVKALRVIKEADVIIYDRLANPDILEHAKDGCEFVYVGKEDGRHIMPQDDINEVIYQNALKHANVVRLKGGDPFVFGRGGEEALYLLERDVKFEIIPGITSAISGPAYAGIPVTHRGVSVSFRVVTGHESPNKKVSQIPWENFKTDDTIIFLRFILSSSVKKLRHIPPTHIPSSLLINLLNSQHTSIYSYQYGKLIIVTSTYTLSNLNLTPSHIHFKVKV